MTNEIAEFKYETLDDSTAEFLRKKESNMREIVGKAYTELGRELKEAQDVLAHHGYGCYYEWCESIGVHRKQAERLTSRYDLITTNCRKQELLEDLPVSLSYEIAKPSAESTPAKSQAKAEVLDGKIDTLKAYKQRIQELETQAQLAEEKRKQAESMAETARKDAEIKERQLERTQAELERATTPKVEVVEREVERIVEVDKTDYSAVDRLRKYEEKFGAIENYSDRVRATNVSDVTTSIISFNMAVRDFIKRHAYLIKYQDTIKFIDGVTQREYNEAVQALKEVSADFCKVSGIGDYVDVEFSEVQQ